MCRGESGEADSTGFVEWCGDVPVEGGFCELFSARPSEVAVEGVQFVVDRFSFVCRHGMPCHLLELSAFCVETPHGIAVASKRVDKRTPKAETRVNAARSRDRSSDPWKSAFAPYSITPPNL